MSRFLIVIMTLAFATSAFAKGGSSSGRRFELNGFYGIGSVNPGDFNDAVTATNSALRTKMSAIKQTTMFGGEFYYGINPNFYLGGRYTTQSGDTGTGKTTVGNLDVKQKVQMDDFSAIVKFQGTKDKFAYYLGLGAGMTTNFKVSSTAASTTTDYTAPATLVGRAMVGGRLMFGAFGIFLEGGYQYAKATEFKNGANALQTTGGKKIAVDLSGIYGLGGIGFQF